MSKPSFAQVVKNPGFKFLWANQILVQLAYNSVNFGLIIWVFLLTGTNLSVAVLMLTIISPTILFGLLAGVLVDISDRRKIILLTDFILALVFLAFAVSKDTYGIILALSFILNTTYQLFVPAEGSSIPLLVAKRQLLLANSLFQLTLFGSILIGYSLAGPIINFFSINSLFIAAGVLAMLGGIISINLPSISSKNGREEKKLVSSILKFDYQLVRTLVFKQIKGTLLIIKGKLPVAVAIGVLAGVQGVVGTLAVLMPAYMEKVMHISATDASYVIMLPLGLGMVAGAIMIGRFGTNIPKRLLVTMGIITSGFGLLFIASAPAIGRAFNALDLGGRLVGSRPFIHAPSLSSFLIVLAFFMGMATVCIITPSQTVLQEYTPANRRGKIFAVLVLPVLGSLGILVIGIGMLGYKPALFFAEHHLPYNIRQFLGLGHWIKTHDFKKY